MQNANAPHRPVYELIQSACYYKAHGFIPKRLKVHYLEHYAPKCLDYMRTTPLTLDELSIRQTVYDFKNGCCPQLVVIELAAGIQKLADDNTVVCFVPASNAADTERRLRLISKLLPLITGIPCSLDAIMNLQDGLPGHLYGKKKNPAADFGIDGSLIKGKRVILIDDIIAGGNTMLSLASKLKAYGAKEVVGLAYAKDTNPKYDSLPFCDVEHLEFDL